MAMLIGNVDKEYEKCKELRKEDVEQIMQWADMQPHLPKMTEMQVILFLHSNYFSSEAAKHCIDLFFTVRTHVPEFFKQRIPANVNFNVMLYTPLPKPTPEGYRVLYAKLIDTNADNFNFGLQIKCFDMRTMLMLNQEGVEPGQIVIHDLTGVTFGHVAKLNVLLLKKFFFYLQDCMPVRIKGLHFINTGNVIDKILFLIKPFMKKELMSVLHTHAKLDSVFDFIPRECFPNDYPGGKAPSFKELCEADKKKLINNTPFFIAEEQQQVIESKRPGKPKDIGEIFGVEGTFKKLDID